jgi:aldehyde dehydrogenase (NAD+)
MAGRRVLSRKLRLVQEEQVSDERTQVLESALILGDRRVTESHGGTLDHINPATGKVNKVFPIASVEEVDEAVAAARAAFEGWRRWSPDARREALIRVASLLEDNGPDIGMICSLEGGQP